MKANELRIGNLYFYEVQDSLSNPDRWLEPSVIDVHDLLYLDTFPDDESFQPMEINDDLLTGFGFEKSGDSHFQTKGMRIWKCSGMYICDKTGTILQYAHQLQNLFQSHNRSELPIDQLQIKAV